MRAPATAERVQQRLEHLYEISKLFASFETVEQTFGPTLAIAAKTLHLASAHLLEVEDGRSQVVAWSTEGQSAGQLEAARERLVAVSDYLLGAATVGAGASERRGTTALPGPAGAEEAPANRFIVIPLVVAHHPPFGTLQVEGARPFDRSDLMFINAIGNQFAIALDRDRVHRGEIARRRLAEEGQTYAEARGVTAVQARVLAEGLSSKFEALATENARLFEEAQRAVTAREQILAVVSHDLRNPLSTILLAAEVLAKAGEGTEQEACSSSLARITRSAQRMLRLIDDLLDFANIEAGRLAIKRGPCDPEPLIREVLASFEDAAQQARLSLAGSVEPGLPALYCDRDRILQVLSNLVGNATKATAPGGHVTLRAEARGPDLLFVVSDDGHGVGVEVARHLFERYWRGAEAAHAGSGLGLAIARGIVDAHGGRIWVESEPGHGASFLFTVPTAGRMVPGG